MAGTVLIADLGIVLRALIGVADHQANRRSRRAQTVGSFVFEDPRQDLDLIGLFPLGDKARLAWTAAIER